MSGNFEGCPRDPGKASAWQVRWHIRYAPRWVVVGSKYFPVDPPALVALAPEPGEPHSAPVIRALEKQINPVPRRATERPLENTTSHGVAPVVSRMVFDILDKLGRD